MPPGSDWVTLASFSHPTEAEPLRGKLESEGIDCFLADQNLVAINPLASAALGGVKLQVRASDLERARRILERDQGVLDDEA
jgi:hypothetical protein